MIEWELGFLVAVILMVLVNVMCENLEPEGRKKWCAIYHLST